MTKFCLFWVVMLCALLWQFAPLPCQSADDVPRDNTIHPSAEGLFTLPVEKAKLTGGRIKLDAERGIITNWRDRNDFATWRLADVQPGAYDVLLTWSVPDDRAGQFYSVDLDGVYSIRGSAPSTGGFDKFDHQIVGRVLLTKNAHEITFHPGGKVHGELMNLKLIELVPHGKGGAIVEDVPFAPAPLQVPSGFEVELAAGPPLVSHPMLACFDDRGRLLICESAGMNVAGNVLAEALPNEILCLEDTNGDGKFDKRTHFADKMTIPQGIEFHHGWVYVSSPPNFWRLRDTDGDGVADEREILLSGFPNRGMSDDMHGSSLGPDGRLYLAAGRFPHDIRAADGTPIHRGAQPHIVRVKPDGTEPEMFCGAQGNAVGVAFTDAGDMFACGTFLDSDMPGVRDGIIHGIEGAEYPVRGPTSNKPEHKWTGGTLPGLAYLGVVAASDTAIYRGDIFGPEYRGNLFSAMFNTRMVLRQVLERDGGTYRCRNEEFLTSTSPDFRPTDVFEDADGSMLVVDTGGWFIIGCPTSQLGKPQVRGGIYRVRRKDAPKIDDPRGLKIAWDKVSAEELAGLLDDQRFAVRDRAIEVLAFRKDSAAPALQAALSGESTPRTRLNAVWALGRIETPKATAALRMALGDADADVRQASAHMAGLLRDADAVAGLSKLLTDESFPVRREAAASLGRIGKPAAATALLTSLDGVTDRFVEHAVVFALIRVANRDATAAGLTHASSQVRRAALIALDQMDGGNLSREEIAQMLGDDSSLVQRTALEVVSRHRGFAGEITGIAVKWLADPQLSADRQTALRGVLASFVREAPVQKLIADSLARPEIPTAMQLLLLDVVGHSELSNPPAEWQTAILPLLESTDAEVVRQAINALAVFKASVPNEVASVARKSSLPADVRVAAASLAARDGKPLSEELFTFLKSQCQKDVDSVTRLAASRALGGIRPTAKQLVALIELISQAGPLELPALISAFDAETSADMGKQLIAALNKSPGVTSLPAARVTAMLQRFPPEVGAAAEPLLKRIQVDATAQAARINELQATVNGGNAQRGRQVFFGAKAACSACHRVGTEGGNIGPNLAGIGDIRTRRDLLEAIVFPSASFARDFEPVNILTTSGKPYSGIISRQTNDAVFLRTTERAEVRIPREEIEVDGISPSKVSIMPQGLDKTLSTGELSDLIEFLGSQRNRSASAR
jgi:putative membrane-bound dehydrogenase-like protein